MPRARASASSPSRRTPSSTALRPDRPGRAGRPVSAAVLPLPRILAAQQHGVGLSNLLQAYEAFSPDSDLLMTRTFTDEEGP